MSRKKLPKEKVKSHRVQIRVSDEQVAFKGNIKKVSKDLRKISLEYLTPMCSRCFVKCPNFICPECGTTKSFL
jgi:hypothetical protein